MIRQHTMAALAFPASLGGEAQRFGPGPEVLRANRSAKAARAQNRWNDVRKHYTQKHAALSRAIVTGEVQAQDVSEQVLTNGRASLVIALRDVDGRKVCVHGFYNHLTRSARERIDFLLYAARSHAVSRSTFSTFNG